MEPGNCSFIQSWAIRTGMFQPLCHALASFDIAAFISGLMQVMHREGSAYDCLVNASTFRATSLDIGPPEQTLAYFLGIVLE